MKSYRYYLVNSLSLLALFHDLVMSALAWCFAFLLRFNFDIPAKYIETAWKILPFVLLIQLLSFIGFGLYRGMWRFASIPDLKRIIKALGVSALMLAVLALLIQPQIIIPRSVLLLNPLLLILLMGGSRFAYRAWKEHRQFGAVVQLGKPVIILGAGDAAIALMKELARTQEWRVVAMLDDNQSMLGREFSNARVEGAIAKLPEIANKYASQHCILAMPSAEHEDRRKAASIASSINLEVLTMPALGDLISGKLSVSQIRKIEVEDLLGRDAVNLDNDGLHEQMTNRAVMVSGAGGSIGSELCRQIINYQPSHLICFDISEFALYQLDQELQLKSPSTQLIYVTGDVKNEQRVKFLLEKYTPTVVFHAAAYKHVPLMETFNVAEALANNVLGTYVMANACMQNNVEKFVLISTDKAVNPTNVMGASKRLAEMVCQSLEGTSVGMKTHFVIVRFGNVLGSSGSVIPKFREQIAKGGPVTVTHPDITRFFMSIPEAAQLVMQAGLMGQGGEIFVLDMGEPVKIAELARDMIRLSGFQQDEIKISYTGLRPGEKLYEELLADDELTQATPHPKLRIAIARKADVIWVKKLLKWIASSQLADELVIKKQLVLWVEEYAEDTVNTPVQPIATLSSTLH
jgi:FlaA1/EpsC-like NDP-sugar epimerase